MLPYVRCGYWQKEKEKIGKFIAKLTFLGYDNFGEREASLQRNGMAAIPKSQDYTTMICSTIQIPD